jgi:hypothetical protein
LADFYAVGPEGSVIMEAKSSAAHLYVRQALSQLLDYVRFSPTRVARIGSLFPRCPDGEGVRLLHDYGIDCTYLNTDGGFTTLPAPAATQDTWRRFSNAN